VYAHKTPFICLIHTGDVKSELSILSGRDRSVARVEGSVELNKLKPGTGMYTPTCKHKGKRKAQRGINAFLVAILGSAFALDTK
jgi:hypothetical protein